MVAMSGTARDDTARIVHRAQAGESSALELLYARHQGRLLLLVRTLVPGWLRSRVEAEDILQETLLESTRKINEFEHRGPQSFYRWLVAIARFKVAEAERAHRAAKRRPEDPLEASVAGDDTSPSGKFAKSEKIETLLGILATLPDRQAEAVRLRYLEGRSVEETAGSLDCSPSAVKALVSRGLRELGRRLPPGADRSR